MEVRAPRIARVHKAGQFVIVRRGPGAERIPLTVAATDRGRGSITLIVQAVGKSTHELVALAPGKRVNDVAGPMGRPFDMVVSGHAVCVGGGVGTAVVYPLARELVAGGARVTTIVGARSGDRVLLEDELGALGPVMVYTDDGSRGHHGLVTAGLPHLLAVGDVELVYAAGPVRMMGAVAELTRPLGVRTIASLNPIMVDGTGMCGGCRVTVGGQMQFACVDGPDFDGHSVDFDELAERLSTYRDFERRGLARLGGTCHE
jgi:ferredoxin--NADP+ reductase